jgi:hypothetical protein
VSLAPLDLGQMANLVWLPRAMCSKAQAKVEKEDLASRVGSPLSKETGVPPEYMFVPERFGRPVNKEL